MFTWAPGESQQGSYDVTFTVTDNGTPNLGDSETITVTVGEVNTAPVLASIGDKSVNEGTELTFTATATDGHVHTAAAADDQDEGAPAGAGIATARVVVTWQPGE